MCPPICRLSIFFLLFTGGSSLWAEIGLASTFESSVRPFFDEYCVSCHDADAMESGIRVDGLDGTLAGRTPFLWLNIRKQIADAKMPPEDESQPTEAERTSVLRWIDEALLEAKRRPREKNGSVRRLTIQQYQNTLQDLLGIEDDFRSLLPPDAVSRDGFLNQEQTMVLSPLLIEAYFEVAERALDICIVDELAKPEIQNFRMDLGKSINPRPCPDKLILGANSRLLENSDFAVTQLKASKPFEFYPFWMKTKLRFNEGYEGNSTVRGWKDYDSIYHSVFACMRGNSGYPKGNAYDVVPDGLLLRPAIPGSLLFGKSSTYGPRANFKIALRELPSHGRFRVKVQAARYADGLLLNDIEPLADDESLAADLSSSGEANLVLPRDGVYQVDVSTSHVDELASLMLTLGDRTFAGQIRPSKEAGDEAVKQAFLQVRLPSGPLRMIATCSKPNALREISLSSMDEASEAAEAFLKFEQRSPTMGVHVGLRRDCGDTLSALKQRYRVKSTNLDEYVYEGAINNFPSPDLEAGNVNYLAGVREIGVRHEYTDGRDMPRLLIRSIEFEGPLYETWPPSTHQAIFFDSQNAPESSEYAREVIERFATRAYRRPATEAEVSALLNVWRQDFEETGDFHTSTKEALLASLTSPQFLFQIESSESAAAESINDFELASKLSYFLWNSPPDQQLLDLAARGDLRSKLQDVVDRMVADERFGQFVEQFASQWLGLDKLDVVNTDLEKYPRLFSETKRELRREPIELLRHLLRENLSIRNLVKSEFVMANEVVADYYGFGDRVECGFDFAPFRHENEHLGGLLSQAGILAGLSDGRESNPVKRGAWLARKIISEPPEDPPPNVPELTADDPSLTLKERLELHRNQPGCVKCHEGIDPWGLPLEEYDAGGRFKSVHDNHEFDASSKLPDGSRVADANELKHHLATQRLGQVAFSFAKHLAIYASGRELSYNETEALREEVAKCESSDYGTGELLRLVIRSPIFLEK